MEYFPAPLEKLVEQFARLPGIGGKSAQRLAFYVLGLPLREAQEFADAIIEASGVRIASDTSSPFKNTCCVPSINFISTSIVLSTASISQSRFVS